ncbi:hypothetical protein [Sphingomonas sp. GC_Shp_3]|uniref:hypothetical protein n=1 Tax=Sphingomonas sp. GC_Shp_3 TaxID=2937383 RepID=UPI002269AB74|nr:hypothetical protein [Sphingomonas sp. GC_Shp_3]
MLSDAQALLQAVLETTEVMAIAGGEAVPANDEAIHSEVAKDVWRAMIQDALSNDHG